MPYVLLPPLDHDTKYLPGTEFFCELTLFGNAVPDFPICYAALEFLGSNLGLGKDQGRFTITQVDTAMRVLSEISARIEDESSEIEDRGASQPRTVMDMAIEEAGINKRDFPVDAGQNTESDLLHTQDDARPEAEHDSLLRTLYIMAPGLVLSKESQRFVIRKRAG